MKDCNLEPIHFPSYKSRLVEASFSGGTITSDGGAVLLRQADRMSGLTERAAKALGYQDPDDHGELRLDPALQTAVDADEPLAGASTLCLLGQRMGRDEEVRLHEALVERFIASFASPLRRLVLDFDATDDPVHGMREGRFFHGYYDCDCFPSLYVFCGDSGFCHLRMLSWCERNRVDYVVGIAHNAALAKKAAAVMELAAMGHETGGKKVRVFDAFPYAARS